MNYPYYRNYVTSEEILKDFQKLERYRVRKTNLFKLSSIESITVSYSSLSKITDYFSEDCRIKCSFQSFKPAIEQYQKIKNKINEDMSYEEIDDILYKNIRWCTNFDVTIVVSVLNFFKPKKYLDFSSGWGDRLIGAMSYGCEYTGVDPSSCMESKYKEMVKFFGKKQDKYKVHKKGFENFKVKKNYYDLVFTSPPFFDLEIYENLPNQSIKKFNTLSKWKKNFLFPSLKKSFLSLKEGGHIAIYVNDYYKDGKKYSYVRDMRKFMDTLKVNFLGTFNWVNIDSSMKIRDIYIWKKL